MSIINFNIPENLERRIAKAMREDGFVSKAEFFRMAAIYYLNSNVEISQEERTKYLVRAIKEEVINKYKGKKAHVLR